MAMIKIAIVEDTPEQRAQLRGYVEDFFAQHGEPVQVLEYPDGQAIVEAYPDEVQLLLLDIDMPRMNGMDAAQAIRERDEQVLIVFITNLIQYAVRGYAVDAMDFLIKPVTAYSCRATFSRVLKKLRQRRGQRIEVKCHKNTLVVNLGELLYAETQGRALLLHLQSGPLTVSESIQSFEERTRGMALFRCHNSFLVNLAFVDRLEKTDAVVAGQRIPISKYRRSGFLQAMADYMGGALL